MQGGKLKKIKEAQNTQAFAQKHATQSALSA